MKKLVLKPMATQAGSRPQPPPASTTVVIGCDLARTKWVYSCRWAGQEQRRLSTPGELRHLQALVQEYQALGCGVEVAYEACGFGYEIAWWLEQQKVAVVVVAPSTMERAPGLQVKTDGLDASSLALKAEKGLLKGIYIPRRQDHEYRQLSRTYGQVLSDRRRQQSRLRLLLQEHGYTPPTGDQGWGALEHWLVAQELPPPVRACVDELCLLRQSAHGRVRRLQGELRKVARLAQYAGLVAALAAQPGVGSFTAIRFILEIGDIKRFRQADSLSNYLGLTPNEYSSGALVHRGHARKCGPGPLRAWLVQCAWVAVRPGQDPALRECFERLAPRAGRKRAIVAVARRLALRLRARWLQAQKEVAQAA
jgi:transposase